MARKPILVIIYLVLLTYLLAGCGRTTLEGTFVKSSGNHTNWDTLAFKKNGIVTIMGTQHGTSICRYEIKENVIAIRVGFLEAVGEVIDDKTVVINGDSFVKR